MSKCEFERKVSGDLFQISEVDITFNPSLKIRYHREKS